MQLTVALSGGSVVVHERRTGSHLELWFENAAVWSSDTAAVTVGVPAFAWAQLTDEHGRVRLDVWLDAGLSAKDAWIGTSPRFTDGGRLVLLQLPCAATAAAEP